MNGRSVKFWSSVGLVGANFLAGVTCLPASNCAGVDCIRVCKQHTDYSRPNDCIRCCSDGGQENSHTMSDEMTDLRDAVKELRVMTGVLLALVLLLILAGIFVFLQLRRTIPGIFKLPCFIRVNKDATGKEKTQQNNCNGVVNTGNAPVSRLANHQSNSSPRTKRPSVSTSDHPPPRPFRVRQPSESTCPEEGNDITPQGYDNLALSTSTIESTTPHNTSNSSTETLGAALSTNTLHTNLPSENHMSNVTQNTSV